MKTVCPGCGTQQDADPALIGQQMKCSNCGKNFEVVNSNLQPCPDCFALISKRAFTCPRCGAPLKDPRNGKQDPHSAAPGFWDISREQSVAVYSPCFMNYLWWIIFGVVTIPFFVGIFLLIFVILDYNFTSYELTTHRVIVRKGWIAKMQNEIWIKDMRGVNLDQNIWQRIIGAGNISIGTAASAETEINIVGIKNPGTVVEKINSLRQC